MGITKRRNSGPELRNIPPEFFDFFAKKSAGVFLATECSWKFGPKNRTFLQSKIQDSNRLATTWNNLLSKAVEAQSFKSFKARKDKHMSSHITKSTVLTIIYQNNDCFSELFINFTQRGSKGLRRSPTTTATICLIKVKNNK